MPALSIIIPTCRHPALLRRAIDSLLAQTFADLEIVVIDNNPRERRVADNLSHRSWVRDPKVRIVEKPGATNAAALRNCGLAVARGEWVTFLDDDDEYTPEKIERQWQEAQSSHLQVGLCQLRFCLPLRRRVRGVRTREMSGDDLLLLFPGMPAVFHARASEVQFDEQLNAGEDMHYFQRLLQHFNASKIFNAPEPLVNVHVQNNAHVNLNAEGCWRATERVLSEFGSKYSSSARRAYWLQSRLGYCKMQRGRLLEMLDTSALLLRERQFRDARLILNSFLFKIPWTRRWIVS